MFAPPRRLLLVVIFFFEKRTTTCGLRGTAGRAIKHASTAATDHCVFCFGSFLYLIYIHFPITVVESYGVLSSD